MTGDDNIVDIDTLIQRIADRLATYSGEGIAEVANDIMGGEIQYSYVGDGFFETSDGTGD